MPSLPPPAATPSQPEGRVARSLVLSTRAALLASNAVTDWRKRPQLDWTPDTFKIRCTPTPNVSAVTVGNTGHYSANAATTPWLTQAPLIVAPLRSSRCRTQGCLMPPSEGCSNHLNHALHDPWCRTSAGCPDAAPLRVAQTRLYHLHLYRSEGWTRSPPGPAHPPRMPLVLNQPAKRRRRETRLRNQHVAFR
jgi:hypothetical protein